MSHGQKFLDGDLSGSHYRAIRPHKAVSGLFIPIVYFTEVFVEKS